MASFGTPAAQLVMPMPYTVVQTMNDASWPHGTHAYWKSEYLDTVTGTVIDTLVSSAWPADAPRSEIHLRHLGGASPTAPPATRLTPTATPNGTSA